MTTCVWLICLVNKNPPPRVRFHSSSICLLPWHHQMCPKGQFSVPEKGDFYWSDAKEKRTAELFYMHLWVPDDLCTISLHMCKISSRPAPPHFPRSIDTMVMCNNWPPLSHTWRWIYLNWRWRGCLVEVTYLPNVKYYSFAIFYVIGKTTKSCLLHDHELFPVLQVLCQLLSYDSLEGQTTLALL